MSITRRGALKGIGTAALANTASLATGLLVTAPARAQSKQKVLNWGFNAEAETLDPYSTTKRTAHVLSRHIIEHLLYRDPTTAEVRPALAKSWKWIDDLTLEFALRDDVKFHDGQSFTADDVVYTVSYIKDKTKLVAFDVTDYGYIKEAQKMSPYVVRLALNAPTPSAVDRLTQTLFILPKGYHSTVDRQTFGKRPIGTGPYRVTGFESARKAEFTKFDGYYPAAWGKPTIDNIVVRCITDPQTIVAEAQSGGVDFVWNIQLSQLSQLRESPDLVKITGGSTEIYFLRLDAIGKTPNSPARDKNVRIAISHAINRPDLARVLMGPTSQVLNSPCLPKQFGCVQDVKSYEYDVVKAKEFLARSSYPNGFPITISAYTDGGPMAEAIVGDLSAIGIKATLDVRETSAILKDNRAGLLAAVVFDWPSSGVYDASAMVANFFQGNQNDLMMDDEIHNWLNAAGTTTDKAVRAANYRAAFEKMANEAYVVPLMTGVTYYAANSKLKFPIPQDGSPLMYFASWG
jgi:peptide/nickel transport system substrate-binding protein